ncbi:hypothetical protein GN244_ATG15988 [Phytophthora infestans]|uniref:Bzip transcription factor n=1 Tax=Phytophthora infestans TaxID=4787 RepID=A0A833SE00_PHYIN|nr:hypothetical protein GN244_ATG15988 [Phytophthora infestans]
MASTMAQGTESTSEAASHDQENTPNSDLDDYRRLLQHRQSRRDIQRRYRAKLHARSVSFERNVERLKDEVARLDEEYRRLTANSLSSTTPWNLMAEYFSLFRDGLTTMTPEVMVKNGSGIDAMLEIWRSISMRRDDLHVRLERLENGPGGSFIATTKCYFTITRSMLLQEFPHVVMNSDEGRPLLVVEKLLGQQIALLSEVRFDWDESTGRMTAVTGRYFKAEMLMPLLKILSNLEDVALVLG